MCYYMTSLLSGQQDLYNVDEEVAQVKYDAGS